MVELVEDRQGLLPHPMRRLMVLHGMKGVAEPGEGGMGKKSDDSLAKRAVVVGKLTAKANKPDATDLDKKAAALAAAMLRAMREEKTK